MEGLIPLLDSERIRAKIRLVNSGLLRGWINFRKEGFKFLLTKVRLIWTFRIWPVLKKEGLNS